MATILNYPFSLLGKPPVDAYGRPLYGGNPFDAPGSAKKDDDNRTGIVTSDGKTIGTPFWGSLPTGDFNNENSDLDQSSSESESESDEIDGDMDESDEEIEKDNVTEGSESVMPPPPLSVATAAADLRKVASGDETPAQLYQVLAQKAPTRQQGGVFQSDVEYIVPGNDKVGTNAEGAASVLSKTVAPKESARRNRSAEEEEDGIGKSFKF